MLEIEVKRVPFFLEPGYPEDESFVEPHLDRMARKFIGPTRKFLELSDREKASLAKAFERHGLPERGAAVGLEFTRQRLAANTLQSHRLVRWAGAKSEALYSVLNRMHHAEGLSLNSRSVLLSAAKEAGLDPEAAARFLASDEGREEVLAQVARVHASGIHSIPTFIVDGTHVVSGAQRSERFVEIFMSIEKEVLRKRVISESEANI